MHMAEGTGTGGEDPLAQTTLPFRMAEMNLATDSTTIPDGRYAQYPAKGMDVPPQTPPGRMETRTCHRCCFRSHCAVPWFNFDRTLGRGNAKLSGLDGILAINGFQFFQMLVSIICWGWFTYQAWMLFPIMRVHAISLLFMWNALYGAQIFFHRTNPNFPLSLNLADMMEGTLILLIVFFFLFFFGKPSLRRGICTSRSTTSMRMFAYGSITRRTFSRVGLPCLASGFSRHRVVMGGPSPCCGLR